MDSNATNAISNTLEQYMSNMRQRVDELKREATKVENDSGKLKQRIVAEIASFMTNDPAKATAAQLIEQRYEHQQKAGEEHAKSLKDTAGTIQKHLSEVESVHTELRRHESSMRDLESKVSAWASRAQELMNRNVM